MCRPVRACFWFVMLSLLLWGSAARAASDEEYDDAKWKLQLNGWVSAPTGYFNGKNGNGYFDLQKDFGFGNYATFTGRLDWRFKRKHHLIFAVTPVWSSRTTTLARTIEWQGQTFDIGVRTSADINSQIFAPGYEYDFFRKKHGYLGVVVNVNLAYTGAKVSAVGSASGGGGSGSQTASASGSLFAPLPAVGPTFQWYPIPNSGKLYLEGALTGMSFFGYGNFVAANALLGFPFAEHWDAHAGYLLGSRLKVTGSSDQMQVRLTQKGPVFGVEYHWGKR